MKAHYTIGEVASLLNISAQTLRFYAKSGVVVPSHIDARTGYRYYTYDQIHYIERVRYLQKFGIRLEDIKTILSTNDISQLKKYLRKRQRALQSEAAQLNDTLNDLEWYLDYYSHIDDTRTSIPFPYKTEEKERFLLAEPFLPDEDIYGTAGQRLTQTQHSEAFSDTRFLRQNGYLLDSASLFEGRIVPTHYFVYLRQPSHLSHPNVLRIPAGRYLCIQSRILAEPFESTFLKQLFTREETGFLVLANEYEDNFTNFKNCIYEIQILLRAL